MWVRFLAAAVAAASIVLVAASASSSPPAQTPNLQSSVAFGAPVDAGHLRCTGPDESANFKAYSAGESLDGQPAAAFIRRCDNPFPGEPIRANYVSVIYGSCDQPIGEDGYADGGCAPPLEVQTWPACERSRADLPPKGTATRIRGVPALSIGDDRLEVYAGKSTIVLFGNPGITVDAAQALRGVNEPLADAADDPSSLGASGRQMDDLPAPAQNPGGGSCGA